MARGTVGAFGPAGARLQGQPPCAASTSLQVSAALGLLGLPPTEIRDADWTGWPPGPHLPGGGDDDPGRL